MRKSKLDKPTWKSEPISPVCEVGGPDPTQMCGRPTTHVYRAYPAGYMALCKKHARQHSEAWPIQEVDEDGDE